MRETETRVQHEGTVRECSCQSTVLESSARVQRDESTQSRECSAGDREPRLQRDESTVHRIESTAREYTETRVQKRQARAECRIRAECECVCTEMRVQRVYRAESAVREAETRVQC